ncbi:hypothetical protein SmaMPs15_000059 [Stenotrophomonas maltophilia phage vB_SmaM_Ps15]|uniref:Uncharacterized protein n=1 Tax=Stenotrophomonas maltophilia phage vB_SmaM_Ps15 TaxID=3071007 RepID=A0AAE9FLJ2_9CAUD|nr:hypothetical protein PQC01_gp059 [Stenotrophomonas maltophilia phage vB_SmaM_Ps15]UMO77210.1 hypothetical protein SmaMPs15_000059 [Stenotrophomonas maltophilia phage vB_SmaM_Ps15]
MKIKQSVTFYDGDIVVNEGMSPAAVCETLATTNGIARIYGGAKYELFNKFGSDIGHLNAGELIAKLKLNTLPEDIDRAVYAHLEGGNFSFVEIFDFERGE